MDNIYFLERKPNGKIIWTKEQEELLIELYKTKSLVEIGELFSIKSYQLIRNKLRSLGVEIIGHRNRYPINENIFEVLDTEEKAYWLGFLYADGCIHSETYELSITLIDKEHLQKFLDFIGAINHKIGETIDYRFSTPKTIFHISIKSKKLVEDLITLGCVPNKTYSLNEIPIMQNHLKMHFIRGFFDGDGSFHYLQSTKNYRISFTGTKELLDSIKEVLQVSVKTQSTNSSAYVIQINGNKQLQVILSKIYKDSKDNIRLERKYKCYLNFLTYLGASPLN